MRSFALLLATAATALAAKVAVTEVANITLVANASIAVFDQAAKTIIKQEGAVTVRSSRLVENADSFRFFVDWESLDASRKFAKSKAYKDMQKQISSVVAEEPVLYHIAFEPSPPVVFDNYEGKGESPFTEFLNFFFPSGIGYNETREANVTDTVTALLEETAPTAEGFTGHTALGWGVEEIPYMGALHRVFAIGVGWETVEAHKTWMTTPAYATFLPQLYALDGLAGIEMRHVSSKIVKK